MAVAYLPAQYVVERPPAPAGGVLGAAAPPAPPAPPAGDQPSDADPWAVAVAVCLLVLAFAVAHLGKPPKGASPRVVTVEGLNAFALFYVMAFVVERLMEPFASISALTPAHHEKARDQHLAVARSATDRTAQDDALDAAAAEQAHVDRWRADRTLIVMGVATVIGAAFAAKLRLYFLVAVGVVPGTVSHGVNVFVTALVIGGGTKPLHDLITRIQKSKDDAKDPAAVT
jgi:hypothetical protein